MLMLDTVNWGMIGAGNVTEMKSGPAFYKIQHSKLVAVMRRNAEKVADYAERHNVSRFYTDASMLIDDPCVNAVYIATPPDTHASYAIQAMKAGKPVYVEKPMARNYAECLEMLRVSEETGMPLFVAYYRRSLPSFLKVKELVEADAIGNPCFVSLKLIKPPTEIKGRPETFHWHVFPDVGGAGHFFDLASHQFDFLDFLFGPVDEVKGIASNRAGIYQAEDTVTGAFQFESGISGSGTWCFVAPKSAEEDIIEIVGEKGKILFSCFKHGDVVLVTNEKITNFNFRNPEHISMNLVQQVVDELRGIGKCVSTGFSAARTSRVLDEMVKNYYAR